ncbi:hypothetical protein BS47DRAFT_185316 [Hydnum rufescens UP504]|uniref:DinB-like domain-containing protein n=1 Tax=Hydnum rufescens UP504 TaxID=1448309 RepID=A0A9P6DSW5_9AGAM|nr:hypothetical protein BS47DRAFT_185316 [Hydnum rufescens UP504]
MLRNATPSSPVAALPSPLHVPEGTVVGHCLLVSINVVEQAIDFLSTLTDDSQMAFPSQSLPGGTIGKHIRHAVEHYNLLLKAVSEGPAGGPHVLSYDVRSRNTPMETSSRLARDELENVIKQLQSTLSTVPLEDSITLHAVTPFPAVMQTTFGREAWFCALHAIHHWSMIRAIAMEQGITCDSSFGVAPSTLAFRGQSSTATGTEKLKI